MFNIGGDGGFGGGLTLHGGATLLAGTYTGALNVTDGATLRIGGTLVSDPSSSNPDDLILGASGGNSGNVIGNVNLSNGTLIFNRDDNFTFGANVSGNGGIVKNGPGVATLDGDINSSASGTAALVINSGGVVINGALTKTGTSPFAIAAPQTSGGVSLVNHGSIYDNSAAVGFSAVRYGAPPHPRPRALLISAHS